MTVNKKMSSNEKGLLIRMRSLTGFSVDELRREFKTPELSTIKSAPWTTYSLNDDDLELISQVQANISTTIHVREKKKKQKKKNQRAIKVNRSLKKPNLVTEPEPEHLRLNPEFA